MDLHEVINDIAAKAEQANEPNESDYTVDGLIYCGNCKTPRQCVVDILGKKRTVFCLCKCRTEKRDAEEAEHKRREMYMRIQSMRYDGFPDAEMQNWTFANDDGKNAKITEVARKYVDNFDEMYSRGKGLLLFGEVGTGKTYISACIANALIDKGRACLVTNFARLVNTISGMYEGKQNYIDSLNNYDLLVIDDLASERDTEYMGEIVQNIIDSRYRAKLPLIVTTNLTSDELKHPAEMRKQRIYSRLFEMCVPVEVKGNDRRKQKLKDDFGELGEMLGLNERKSND